MSKQSPTSAELAAELRSVMAPGVSASLKRVLENRIAGLEKDGSSAEFTLEAAPPAKLTKA